jgi:serine/threonine-protein kinase
MSPEQCSGAKVDHRADVYSLGCVIFESLTGSPPFVGENALMTMMMHQTAAIPTLKERSMGAAFSPVLERIVALMLAKNPEDRYQNLGEAAHELAALKRGEAPKLNAAIKPKRPAQADSQAGVVLNRHHFISAMIGIALATFTLSSVLTYFTQHANIQRANPTKLQPTEPETIKDGVKL